MKTAVYSGSFNPLHIGHLAIIRHLIDKESFDMVYLIVSPKNPLKEGISSSSGKARHAAAEAAVNRHFTDKVKVDDIELNMPEPHYTITTLDELRKREAFNDFILIIGADNLYDIRRWKDYRRILREYGVAVFPRQGYDMEKSRAELIAEDASYKIMLMNAEMVDVSSTMIRNAIKDGQDVSEWLM